MNLSKFAFVAILIAMEIPSAQAGDSCDAGHSIKTPRGPMVTWQCSDKDGHPSRSYLTIDGKRVFEGALLKKEDSNESFTQWVVAGDASFATGCRDGLFFMDLNASPIKIIKFGVKKACNSFESASWGKTSTTITLKHNVKFTYKNGKMLLPEAGNTLWHSIETPTIGPGLGVEDAVPYAEQLAPLAAP